MEKFKYFLTSGVVLLLIQSFTCKKLINCDNVRMGDFYYYAKKTREKVNIHRTSDTQIETDAQTGNLISKNKIVWKDECNYDMFLNANSDTKLTGDDSIIANTPVHVKITLVRDAFYICNVQLNIFGKDIRLTDTIYRDSVL